MGANSKIEWTDHTFNPWMGCTKVSPGCAHCYAEREMARHGQTGHWGPAGSRKLTGAAYWRKPVRWNKQPWAKCGKCNWRGPIAAVMVYATNHNADFSFWEVEHTCPQCGQVALEPTRQRVFCGSMCDVFEDRAELDAVRYNAPGRMGLWELIEQTPNLDWLLLTKRPENVMTHMIPAAWKAGHFPENIWMGTSVEDQERATQRIPELLKIPAKVRFLSCEPLLGPVDIERALCTCPWPEDAMRTRHLLSCQADIRRPGQTQKWPIDWVIAGGESGPLARPMEAEWVRSLREQCRAAGTPFFFKQWGEWLPADQATAAGMRQIDQFGNKGEPYRPGKQFAGRLLDGREWSEFPNAGS